MIRDVQELRLEYGTHAFFNRDRLVDGEIVVEPVRSVEDRTIAPYAWNVRRSQARRRHAIGLDQRRIDRVHPRTARMIDADVRLQLGGSDAVEVHSGIIPVDGVV